MIVTGGAALAHHSFAMFDQENPLELEGSVQEFKFTSPHTFIILTVKQEDGTTQAWSLEGAAPSALIRDGWSSKTLKAGDELKLTIEPLRSGAPGGAWAPARTTLEDGKPSSLEIRDLRNGRTIRLNGPFRYSTTICKFGRSSVTRLVNVSRMSL